MFDQSKLSDKTHLVYAVIHLKNVISIYPQPSE